MQNRGCYAKTETMFESDHQELDHVAGDFAGLGLGDGISVSAAHGRNIKLLLSVLDSRLTPFAESAREAEEASCVTGLKIVVIGRPNAGKSSLVNAILDDDRTIVSEVAGTTRDAVDVPYDRAGERHTAQHGLHIQHGLRRGP